MSVVTRKVNGKKIAFIEPEVRAFSYATAPTITTFVSAIDWYFPQPKKNEDPAIYVGRVARFMRQWHGLTLEQACQKFKISYTSLWRIEKGKWQSIKTTNNYLFNAYGLQMNLEFAPKKGKK